jgi:hypothetical protein
MTAGWKDEIVTAAEEIIRQPTTSPTSPTSPRPTGPANARMDTADGISEIDWLTFWKRDSATQLWQIEPIVPAGREVAIYAGPKVGKSLLVLEMAAAKATARPLLGQEGGEPIDVVYIDNEMCEDDLYERLQDLGYGPEDDLGRLHYYQLAGLPPLDTPTGGEVLLALAHRHDATMVVVDTVASSVAGEENSSDTMRAFHRHTGLRLKAEGRTVVRLDHSGKDKKKGQRGTSAKADDVDVVFQFNAVNSEGYMTLKRTHSRLSWVPNEVKLRRETEPLVRHVPAPTEWPAHTAEVARLLDDLGVAIDASTRSALAALRSAGQGRNTAVVAAALKYRQGRR